MLHPKGGPPDYLLERNIYNHYVATGTSIFMALVVGGGCRDSFFLFPVDQALCQTDGEGGLRETELPQESRDQKGFLGSKSLRTSLAPNGGLLRVQALFDKLRPNQRADVPWEKTGSCNIYTLR